MMILILKMMSEELNKANFCVNGKRVFQTKTWTISPQKKPPERAQAMFFKGLREGGGDETKCQSLPWKLSGFLPCGSGTARTEATGSQILTRMKIGKSMKMSQPHRTGCCPKARLVLGS